MVRLPAENEVLADKYRIERVIGRGGMGVVLAAWHLALDQRVALKFLQPELAQNGESAERFLREARAAAKIKSEHGVRVLDVGNFDGNVPYMVMEFLDGRDLADELRDRGPLPIQECVNYALQAIDAVAEAHALGIVHRDLKPENLFLARLPDGTRCVKVLDFGISKTIVVGSAENRSLTQSSTIMGSPLYMSPEQMRAPRSVDTRTDIWSLGAIVYELLAGRPPYIADTLPQLCAKLLESDPPPLRELRPEIDPALEGAIARCLARNVADRWASMSDVAQVFLPFASRSSQIHAERAGRVLQVTEISVPPVHVTLPSATPGRATPVRLTPGGLSAGRIASPARSMRDQPFDGARSPVGETETRGSWENTRGSRGDDHAPRRKSTGRGLIPFAVGGAVLVLGAAAWMWSSRQSATARVSTPVLSATVLDPAAAVPSSKVPAEPPTATAVAGPAPEIEPRAMHDGGISSPPGSPRPIERESTSEHRPRKAVPPAPQPASSPQVKGLTDFGGRR